jgi:23S rRNA pseudouridine2605 synthase
VKRVLESLGLKTNRLIRISFGPFQLADLPEGEVREIRGRVLRDQLGPALADKADADFTSPVRPIPQAKAAPGGRGRPSEPEAPHRRPRGHGRAYRRR